MRSLSARYPRHLAILCGLMASLVPWSGDASGPQAAGGSADAGSIVYIKQGNVWLADASRKAQRKLTSDGGYRSPSMANDGTIGVLRDAGAKLEFVRLRPTGAVLGRFVWPFSTTQYPVHRAALSPDGATFAYIFPAVCVDRRGGGVRKCLRLAFTPADRYHEDEATGTRHSVDYISLAWMTNQRLVVTGPANHFGVEIYVRGPGIDMQSPSRFENRSHDYKIFHAALSPDGRRMVTHQRRFLGYEEDGFTDRLGPHEFGIYEHAGPMQYELKQETDAAGVGTGPSISPDGSAWVFADDRGVLVHVFGTREFRIVDRGGREPSWGRYVPR